MQLIEVPPDVPWRPAFMFVAVDGPVRWVALLDRWWHLPDGRWACRLVIPGAERSRGLPPATYTVLADDSFRPLTKFDLVQPEPE